MEALGVLAVVDFIVMVEEAALADIAVTAVTAVLTKVPDNPLPLVQVAVVEVDILKLEEVESIYLDKELTAPQVQYYPDIRKAATVDREGGTAVT